MEKFNVNPSESKKFRHDLIQGEFREALTLPNNEVYAETSGVIILSAKEFVNIEGEIDYLEPANLENIERIEAGINLIKSIVSIKTDKNLLEDLSVDILNQAPPLILCGTTEQIPLMLKIALDKGFPNEKIMIIDCGLAGTVNTKTQFEKTNEFIANKNFEHLTFVTSDYHIPRTKRTAYSNIDSNINFDVTSVPDTKFEYDVFKVVRGEVNRIISYSDKGDISKHIPG